MHFTTLSDDAEDCGHSPAERAHGRIAQHRGQRPRQPVASTQIVAGILAKSQYLIANEIHLLSAWLELRWSKYPQWVDSDNSSDRLAVSCAAGIASANCTVRSTFDTGQWGDVPSCRTTAMCPRL